MRTFHHYWPYVVVVTNIAAGIWGLRIARRRGTAPPAFWRLVIAGQAALAVQVVVGVILFQRVRPPGVHVFYGFMLLIVAALSWAFRGEGPRRALTVSSAVALFVGVVTIRAMFTA